MEDTKSFIGPILSASQYNDSTIYVLSCLLKENGTIENKIAYSEDSEQGMVLKKIGVKGRFSGTVPESLSKNLDFTNAQFEEVQVGNGYDCWTILHREQYSDELAKKLEDMEDFIKVLEHQLDDSTKAEFISYLYGPKFKDFLDVTYIIFNSNVDWVKELIRDEK